MTASITVTQVLAYAEIGGDANAPALIVSQALAYAEIGPPQRVDVTQLLVYVEIDTEIRGYPVAPGTGNRPASPAPTAVSVPPGLRPTRAPSSRLLSPRAQLMAAQRTLAPTARLPRSSTGFGGGTVGQPMAQLAEQRTVAARIEIDWDANGSYTDESANLISARGSQQLLAPQQAIAGGSGTTDGCTIQLQNNAGRYSVRNTAGALYSVLQDGKWFQRPVKISVTIGATTTVLFTGVIRNLSEQTKTPNGVGMVTLDCRSKDDLLLRQHLSSDLTAWLTSLDPAQTEDWHIITLLEAGGMVDGADFVSQTYADAHPGTLPSIDPGLFPLPYVWLDDESPLSEIWAIAAACGGWFYCDADGLYHYHNLTGMIATMLARHYGSLLDLALDETNVSGISLAYADANLASELTVEIAPRETGAQEELWTPDELVVVQPGATKVVWARLSAPLLAVPTLTWAAYTAGGVAISTGLTVTPAYYTQRVKLTIVNASTTQAAYFNTLSLTGQQLIGGRTAEITTNDPTDTYWQSPRQPITRSIRGNLYLQTDSHAQALADYLLAAANRPALTASVNGVDDPAARIGQTATATRTDAIDDPVAGVIVGVNWTLDRNGYKHDITLMDTTQLWADGTVWFVLAINVLGDEDAEDEAYLFY
jgi:hypothetical protein